MGSTLNALFRSVPPSLYLALGKEGDYSVPRWYIDVLDAVDAVYLMLTLERALGSS